MVVGVLLYKPLLKPMLKLKTTEEGKSFIRSKKELLFSNIEEAYIVIFTVVVFAVWVWFHLIWVRFITNIIFLYIRLQYWF